jgi:hypothetical protein
MGLVGCGKRLVRRGFGARSRVHADVSFAKLVPCSRDATRRVVGNHRAKVSLQQVKSVIAVGRCSGAAFVTQPVLASSGF